MITVRNESTFKKLYEEHTNMFIDKYCESRKIGYTHEMALNLAKLHVVDSVVYFMFRSPKIKSTIFCVYKAMQEDYSLYEKAVKKFDTV